MQEYDKSRVETHENEVDLGAFFTIISKAFKKIGSFFTGIFQLIAAFFLGLLLLIKRNLLWLIISAVAGFSFGLYHYYKEGPSYYGEMVVGSNFESSRLLYQKIEYFNALVKEHKIHDLARLFNISEEEAGKLGSFEIEPIDDALQKTKLYKQYLLDFKRNASPGVDSVLYHTIKYEEFTSKLTPYDYPLHTIRLNSKSATVYPRVQQGMIQTIQNNAHAQYAQRATTAMLHTEENILSGSLTGLDSLRKAYNTSIRNGDAGNAKEGSIVLSQTVPHAPQIELYDKELLLKDELMEVKKKSIEQQDIIQVYSDFNNVGTRVPKINEEFIVYTEWALLITFIMILLIRFYKYLEVMEKRQVK